ncbi:hypothetical protein [Paenibacillus sp. KS-LC4]
MDEWTRRRLRMCVWKQWVISWSKKSSGQIQPIAE